MVAPEVVLAEVVGAGDPPREEPAPQRAVGHHPGPQLAQGGQHLVLQVAGEQRPLVLPGADRVDGMGPPHRRRRRLRDPQVPDLARLDQLGHRPPGVLDRHRPVHPVLVVQVDVVDPEPLQRLVTGPPRVVRLPVDADEAPVRRRWFPNLLASTTSSRRPAMARPTSRSLVNGPYMSAVSRNVMPRSSARWMVATDSRSSAGPYDWLIPMHPSPSSGTTRPCPPSVRCSIPSPPTGDGAQGSGRRRASGGVSRAEVGGVSGQVGGGLGPPGDLELGQDAGDVVLDRLLGQAEVGAELAVGPAVGGRGQDAFLLERGGPASRPEAGACTCAGGRRRPW